MSILERIIESKNLSPEVDFNFPNDEEPKVRFRVRRLPAAELRQLVCVSRIDGVFDQNVYANRLFSRLIHNITGAAIPDNGGFNEMSKAELKQLEEGMDFGQMVDFVNGYNAATKADEAQAEGNHEDSQHHG